MCYTPGEASDTHKTCYRPGDDSDTQSMCYTPGEDSDTLGESKSVSVAAREDGREDEGEDAGGRRNHVHDANIRLL